MLISGQTNVSLFKGRLRSRRTNGRDDLQAQGSMVLIDKKLLFR